MRNQQAYRTVLHRPIRRAFLLALLVNVTVQFVAHAQSPYRIDVGNELLFTGVGVTSLGTGAYLRDRITLFTPEELERIDRLAVIEFDRSATRMISWDADQASNYFLNAAQLLPVVFLAGKKSRSYFGQIALMYGETMLINGGLTAITKYAVHRPRPYVFNGDASLSAIQSTNAQASFVSGHVSITAAASFFTAKVYSDFYPDSKWKPVVWSAAALVPAVTGYLRVRAGKHYPTDVIGGYALGAAVGFLVPHLHRDRGQRHRDISLSALPNGFYFTMDF